MGAHRVTAYPTALKTNSTSFVSQRRLRGPDGQLTWVLEGFNKACNDKRLQHNITLVRTIGILVRVVTLSEINKNFF